MPQPASLYCVRSKQCGAQRVPGITGCDLSLMSSDHEGQVHHLAPTGNQTVKLEGGESKKRRSLVSKL